MFHKAERKRAKLRLALYGLTNSGKTYSALSIATGMGGRIAMIDTESGRGELHASEFNYDAMQIVAPYSPQKYINAIKEAEKAGYDILIIDSLSHAWSGAGGILSVVDDSGNNKFGGWKHATPLQNELIDAIVNSKMHIIATMRAKAEWVLELNEKGKQAPRKVGMGFVQRDGVDYEFTVVMQMSPENNVAYVEKDNTHNYDKQFVKPTKEMGVKFIEWLNSGVDKEGEALAKIEVEFATAETSEQLKSRYLKALNQFPNLSSEIVKRKDIHKERFEEYNLGSVIPPNAMSLVMGATQ